MATENKIQNLVHKIEEGGWVKWIQFAVLCAAVGFIAYLWFFDDNGFKGLSHEKAMEQGQIARELARGNGFSTKMIRPAALWQFQTLKGRFPLDRTPDTYHAPLWPTVLAPFMWLAKDTWVMTTKDVIYTGDRVIAGVATFFFLLAVGVNFLLARRLFDSRLALIAAGLLLLCDHLWRFSMSGLPQMLMLFIFSCAAYTLLRAVEAHLAAQPQPLEMGHDDDEDPFSEADLPPEPVRAWYQTPLPWLVATGLLFGILALAHALTIWIFGGALLFSVIYFRPWARDTAIMLAVFLLVYSPWLVRNHKVCGNPLGLGWYAGLSEIRGSESQVMRSMALEAPLAEVTPFLFRGKITVQIIEQLGDIYGYLGNVLVAPLFFVALLHLFRRRETAHFRWAILCMWLTGLLGMAAFGLKGKGIEANDMHVLFIPLTTFYGLAFVLVLWSRREITVRLFRVGFITALFILSAFPFLGTFIELLRQPISRVQWPPYVPPWIAVLAEMTNEREIITSDMPWAVAWYADRKSLWLPMTIKDFTNLNDYNLLEGRMVGLYLTPITGNASLVGEILKGEYKEWSPFILRTANVKNFPLRAVTALPIENECIFYADRDRWSTRED